MNALDRFDARLASARGFRESLVEIIAEIGEPTEVGLLHAVWGVTRGGNLGRITGESHPYAYDGRTPYLWVTTASYNSSTLTFGLMCCVGSPRHETRVVVRSPLELRPAARLAYDRFVSARKE